MVLPTKARFDNIQARKKGGIRSTMAEAVLAAYHRAQTLGKAEGDPR